MRFGKFFGWALLLAFFCVSTAFAAPRFRDNGDQTVTDTLTGLMWTKDANLPPIQPAFQEALDYVAAMNSANALGHNDWRIPTFDELWSLVDHSQSDPALSAGHPFINVQSSYYWSSTPTTDLLSPTNWEVDFSFGYPSSNHTWNSDYMWPVRGAWAESLALPEGITGVSYSQQLTVPWGFPPYTWSLVSGALPIGLSLNHVTGVVTGVPTKSGVYSFSIQSVDATGITVIHPKTITVTNAACANEPVRTAVHLIPFADIPSAYALAVDGEILQLQSLDFSGNLSFDRNIRVSLLGGYDCDYTGNTAMTGLIGAMRVSGGTAKVENLRFK
jgi:Protein of unknown function (DUF1566)/Putative Ig domain